MYIHIYIVHVYTYVSEQSMSYRGKPRFYSNTSHLMHSAAWCIMLNFLFNSAVTWLW